MRVISVMVGLMLVVLAGVGVIHADGSEGIPLFTDGRVNNWQIDAPVAVYCVFSEAADDSSSFERAEVWGLDGNKLLEASAAQIDTAQGAGVLDTANGYTLAALASGSFEVRTPDGYVFNWERGDANC